MKRNDIVFDCIMGFFFGLSLGNAINSLDLTSLIFVVFYAVSSGVYLGIRFLDYMLKKKGYVKLDGKIYDLRSRI